MVGGHMDRIIVKKNCFSQPVSTIFFTCTNHVITSVPYNEWDNSWLKSLIMDTMP